MSAIPELSIVNRPDQAGCLLDNTRQGLLRELRQPDSAAGLARRLGLPRQRLNYHLRELERAGLVQCVGERRKGNCNERVLQTSAGAFMVNPAVLGDLGPRPGPAADRASAAALAGAAAETIRSVAALEQRARTAGKRLATLTLEAEVRFASAEARAAFTEELTAAVARLVARFHDDDAPGGRRFRLMVGAHPAVPALPAATEGGSDD